MKAQPLCLVLPIYCVGLPGTAQHHVRIRTLTLPRHNSIGGAVYGMLPDRPDTDELVAT